MGAGESIESMSDGDLAARIARAAPAAAHAEEAELYARFATRVRSYGRRHLRDDAASADLVQRVLALTIEKLRAGAVREPERIGSFVLGVARMVSHEIRRDHRREQPMSDALPEIGGDAPAPPEPFARERLAACLDELGERDRAVLTLTYFGEQSAREIAEALAITEGNVRIIRHRALARVRDCMNLESKEATR